MGNWIYETSEIYFNGQNLKYQKVYTDGEYEIYVNITSLSNNNEIIVKWDKKFSTNEKMFLNCDSLISLDLSNFDTSSVKDMRSIFSGCNSLISINLSNFDTSSVTEMRLMFLDVIH